MADPFPVQAWAWRQELPPEEKLVLLVLVDGEQTPALGEIQRRTGIGAQAVLSSIDRLKRRGLIDDELHPVGP